MTDYEIVTGLVYQCFPDIKSELNPLYVKHKNTITARDNYVHASSFVDQSTNESKMNTLFISIEEVVSLVQATFDFILTESAGFGG